MKQEHIKTPEDLLTHGLVQGFAGGTEIKLQNGGLFKTSRLKISGGNYNDTWTDSRIGGGHEIAKFNGKLLLRQYAGGTLSEEELKVLGIAQSDVMAFLKKQLIENGEKTRLYDNCTPDIDGHWRYSYRVEEQLGYIPLTVGKEVIEYQGAPVFLHMFFICPIE